MYQNKELDIFYFVSFLQEKLFEVMQGKQEVLLK